MKFQPWLPAPDCGGWALTAPPGVSALHDEPSADTAVAVGRLPAAVVSLADYSTLAVAGIGCAVAVGMVCNTEELHRTCEAQGQDVVVVDCILAQVHKIYSLDVAQNHCCCPFPHHIQRGTCSSAPSGPSRHFQTAVLVRL